MKGFAPVLNGATRHAIAPRHAKENDAGPGIAGQSPHRNFRLEISRLARRLLPRETSSPPGTRVCLTKVRHHRAEWIILFPAETAKLPSLVRRDAAGFHLCHQGFPLYHPHASTAECRRTA